MHAQVAHSGESTQAGRHDAAQLVAMEVTACGRGEREVSALTEQAMHLSETHIVLIEGLRPLRLAGMVPFSALTCRLLCARARDRRAASDVTRAGASFTPPPERTGTAWTTGCPGCWEWSRSASWCPGPWARTRAEGRVMPARVGLGGAARLRHAHRGETRQVAKARGDAASQAVELEAPAKDTLFAVRGGWGAAERRASRTVA